MPSFRHLAICCSLLMVTVPLIAKRQRTGDPPVSVPPRSVQIPKLAVGPKLADFEGMAPHGAATKMAMVTGFIEQDPTDGAPATQRTQVYLGYDNLNLYVVWLCFDTQRNAIRAHMVRRENIYDDDYVEVGLDTFHDQRHALVFDVNPLGIQADALYTDGSGTDNSWDTLWYTQGKLTSAGYMVWIAIPFRSLRFHAAENESWGIVLMRYIPRTPETDFWPRVSNKISSSLKQEASLTGLAAISPGRNMQFIPYTSLRGFRAIDDRDPAHPVFSNRTAEGRAGLDSKFVFRDSLVLDTTINPDFSQVESDEPQNTVNQRFEVFFPEKRPFFLENSNYFEPGANGPGPGPPDLLLFTRRIADPEFGIRLTGKQGPWNLGLLLTDDRSPGKVVPPDDPLSGKRAYFAVAKVTHDVGAQSSIGAIYTDREFDGQFNRVGGLDARFRLSKNWSGTLRSVMSSTLNSNGYGFGQYHGLRLDGQGERFYYTLQYRDITPNFVTETGFVPRTDIRDAFSYFHFYWKKERKHLLFWGPELTAERIWDHHGTGLKYNLNGDIAFVFRRNTVVAPIYGVQSDTLRPQDFSGLPFNHKFSEDFGGFVFRSAPWRQLNFSSQVIRSGAVNIVVPAGQLPNEGDETSANVTVTVRPVGALTVDNTYILDRVLHRRVGHAVFNNHIFRSKWNYQVTRELAFRIITQYNNLLANPTFSSLTTTRNLNFDFLITYLVHPGTAVYVGYNSDVANIAPGLCLHVAGTQQCDAAAGLLRTPNGFINDGRQFFVKVSYLFRR